MTKRPPKKKAAPVPAPRSTLERGQIDVLLAEIRNDAAADAPRQILADLLEQRGEVARAQFIQLQLKRASLPAWDGDAVILELQERALLGEHGKKWRAELPQHSGVQWGPFARGFVDKVRFATFDAFVAHGASCFAAAPVRGIAIPWPRSGKTANVDAIPGLRELTVVGTVMNKKDLTWLGTSPLLSTVRSLTLLDSQLKSFEGLLDSPQVQALETLCLPLHLLADESIYKLVKTALPNLTTLDLSVGTPEEEYGGYGGYGRRSSPRPARRTLTHDAAIALADWKGLAPIRSLDVSACKFGVKGLTALLKSPHTKHLTSLTIRSIADEKWEVDDSLTAFGVGPAGALDELDISDNDLDADAAANLARNRALAELKILRAERVVSKHFDQLAKAPWFDSLRILACGEAALYPFVKRAPKQLHTLRVVPDGAPKDLVRRLLAGPLPSVRALDLSDARLNDAGLRLLGTAETLSKVISLRLAGDGARPFARNLAVEFLASPFAKQLVHLDIGYPDLDRLPAPPRVAIGEGDYAGPRRFL